MRKVQRALRDRRWDPQLGLAQAGSEAFLGVEAPPIRLAPIHNGHLIWIKASIDVCATMAPRNRRSRPMALDVILVVCIAAGFGTFAATLYWADLQTRELGK
jgi:hypothetical protein